MAIQKRLLGLLSDGALHSGSELADSLGVTRAAIWKHIRQLQDLGLEIHASKGKGYRLEAPLELLDRARIERELSAAAKLTLGSFELLWVAESTNDYLLDVPLVESGQARACLAEFQTGGRGRRGRSWLAPAGHGICMSVAWHFETTPASISCLGLAVGLGALRALRACGAADAELKWPNDVVDHGRKLAGILVDVRGESNGPLRAVVGVGVNYQLNKDVAAAVLASGGLEPTCLVDSARGDVPGRNAAAGTLVNEVLRVLDQFGREGFSALADEWRSADYLRGRGVTIVGDQQNLVGVAEGIADDGRLCVRSGEAMHFVVTGDISVRPEGSGKAAG